VCFSNVWCAVVNWVKLTNAAPYVARLVHGHSPPERRGLSDSLDGLNCTKALSTRVPFKSSRTC